MIYVTDNDVSLVVRASEKVCVRETERIAYEFVALNLFHRRCARSSLRKGRTSYILYIYIIYYICGNAVVGVYIYISIYTRAL